MGMFKGENMKIGRAADALQSVCVCGVCVCVTVFSFV